MNEPNNTAAALAFASRTTEPKTITVTFEGQPQEVIVTSGENGKVIVTPVIDLFSKRAAAPQRRRGTIVVHDLATFIATTNRDSDTGSVVFADVGARKVTAVLDFHLAGGSPRWGQDRVEYGFTLSPQLQAWIEASRSRMDQKTFAKLVDDRLNDIANAEDVSAGSIAATFAARRGVRFADVADLVKFTRSIAAKSTTESEELYDENTGDVSIQYKKKSDVKAPDGAPIAVPACFALQIPILCGKEAGPFSIAVRLRYEVDGSRIAWRIELHALDTYVLAAIDAALEFVRGAKDAAVPGCGLPVFMGVAPAV